jgi:regulator of sirC expression with transglutaminase-like and TPR domain
MNMLTLSVPDYRGSLAARRPNVVQAVQAVLCAPEEELDYARAKVALDLLIDPAADAEWTFAELDRLTATARQLAGSRPTEQQNLHALRTLIYRSGPWNDHHPYDYHHDDFKELRVKLLAHYLASRRGNCVSMPILFLILADRIGLDMSLAMAAAHLFVRWRDANGAIVNLETTSGANPARDVWLLQGGLLTEQAVASGFYRRSLPRRQAIAAMALSVVEHLMEESRYREALGVAELLVGINPRDGFAWAHQGHASCQILGTEFLSRYGSPWLIPSHARAEYLLLLQRNHHAFAAAHRLGWESMSHQRYKGENDV